MKRDMRHSSRRPNVLVIDQDPEYLAYLSVQCQLLGLSTQKATSVMEALGQLDRKRPDLLIIDYELPFLKGMTFLDRLADDPSARRIPAIVLSAREDLSNVRRVKNVCAYYTHKSAESWPKIETFIYELTDLEWAQVPSIHVPFISLEPKQGEQHDPSE